MRLFALLLSVGLAHAADVPLCCGRGAAAVVPHSREPLLERASPFAGDVLLALDAPVRGPAAQRLSDALSRVPGVMRVEVEEVRPLVRVWVSAAPPVAGLCAAARAEGHTAVPAPLARVSFGDAGEKYRVQKVGAALARVPGVVFLEVESEGEDGVARVWHRPGVTRAALEQALGARVSGLTPGF